MAINTSQLKGLMVHAAKQEVGDAWPEIRLYAESEARKIAETIKMIGKLAEQQKITPTGARLHLRIQKNAAMTVLLTVEGMSLLAVENMINATIRAIRDSVNSSVPFALIP
jgi:hypothetical protein